jgi:RNA polymerase sigma-70 factor (ECF subfamily)
MRKDFQRAAPAGCSAQKVEDILKDSTGWTRIILGTMNDVTAIPPVLDELLQTRHSLLGRLKDLADEESWREFFTIYWKFIYGVARKAGLTDSEAQDVVQETIIYVSRKMPGFNYDKARGSFKGWLTKLTKWRIADQFRKRDGHLVAFVPTGPDEPDPFLDLPDPASLHPSVIDEEWESNLVDAALQRVKDRVKPVQFQMFELYVMKQMPIKKVTALLGVNFGQVYLAKHRITALLREEVRKLEARC